MDFQSKTAKRRQKQKELLLRKRRRNVLIVMSEAVIMLILCITCFGLSVAGEYNYSEIGEVYKESIKRTSVVKKTDAAGSVIGTEYVHIEGEDTGYRNILILGVDNSIGEHVTNSLDQRGNNSDVMIIASINQETGDIRLVSILRDMIMKMEEGSSPHEYDKANNQFAVSGVADTISMVNRNLGLDISEYVLVNWYGVAQCINQMGGIEITIPNETILYYLNSYLTFVNDATGIFAPQLEAPGTYNLMGTQVVAYSRIRYGGVEDEGRANHHREVITKLLEKAKVMFKEGQINTLISVAETGLENVMTNLSMPEIVYLISTITKYQIADNECIPHNYAGGHLLGNYPSKYNVVDPMAPTNLVQEVKDLHAFLFDDLEYEPSDFVKEVSEQIQRDIAGE